MSVGILHVKLDTEHNFHYVVLQQKKSKTAFFFFLGKSEQKFLLLRSVSFKIWNQESKLLLITTVSSKIFIYLFVGWFACLLL